jgi:glutamate-1-semialdehyde 2,1-aminomutase
MSRHSLEHRGSLSDLTGGAVLNGSTAPFVRRSSKPHMLHGLLYESNIVPRFDDDRLDQRITEQERIFLERQPTAARWHQRSVRSLAGGVTSSWQISRPQPIWLSHGRGSRLWDLDGHEYVDFHGGYGVGLAGHAHPAIVRAISERAALGTHFAQPTPDAPIVSEELARRFRLPVWRFGNSGTEATMDAIHLMRSVTGRDRIIKFEGAYHGHHDSVQVSVLPETGLGSDRRPNRVAASSGIPSAMIALTLVAPFNDLQAVEALFDQYDGEIAGVIIEPVMMNCGIIPAEPAFLDGLRALTQRRGALLAFDEVKTGLTIHAGGAVASRGVTPDIICLAKALGGGVPISAIGGTHEVMDHIARGEYEQVGTFNGNPLALAAARANLLEVLTPEAYAHISRLQERLVREAEQILRHHGISARVMTAGAKGCISYSSVRPRNYRDFLSIDGRYAHCAWLFQFNGGVFLPPWTKGEQWLISVQHDDDDLDRYLLTLQRFARALRE